MTSSTPLSLDRARFNMIEQQVRPWEVLDPAVLELLDRVRRDQFVPPAQKALAYVDMELPLGSGVVHEQSGTQTVVGWDGLVYLENLQAQNTLQVTLADGKACRVQFAVDMNQDQIPLIGPLVCQ